MILYFFQKDKYFKTKFVKKRIMKRFSPIFQIFFKVLLIFLIVFVWMRYFVKSLVYATILSAILTCVIDFLTRTFGKMRQDKINLKKKEISDAENMFLSLSTKDNTIPFFKSILSKKHQVLSKKKYLVYDDNVILFPLFSLSTITPDEIASVMKITKIEKAKKVIIVARDFSSECQKYLKIYDKEILLLNQYETYQKIYKSYDIYPDVLPNIESTKKTTIKDLLAFSFNPARTKGYIFSALIIFVCSLFVRATLYYAIVTSILIMFAIISFANPFHIKKMPKEEI